MKVSGTSGPSSGTCGPISGPSGMIGNVLEKTLDLIFALKDPGFYRTIRILG